ncbi:hypothetical protein ABVT39_019103 [Epinephelus coioides]
MSSLHLVDITCEGQRISCRFDAQGEINVQILIPPPTAKGANKTAKTESIAPKATQSKDEAARKAELQTRQRSKAAPAPSARVEDLEEFIDHYYYECVMEGPADNPNERKKTDSTTDTQDLLSSEFSILESINKKLEVLGMLHQEIKDLKDLCRDDWPSTAGGGHALACLARWDRSGERTWTPCRWCLALK